MNNALNPRKNREVGSTSPEHLAGLENAYQPDVDICESDRALMLTIDLPGVAKGEVKIEIDETNTLIVRAPRSIEEKEHVLLRQFHAGNFYRSFQLGDLFEKDKVSAKLEEGVLEITIPKREDSIPRRIAIAA